MPGARVGNAGAHIRQDRLTASGLVAYGKSAACAVALPAPADGDLTCQLFPLGRESTTDKGCEITQELTPLLRGFGHSATDDS